MSAYRLGKDSVAPVEVVYLSGELTTPVGE